MTRSGWVWAIAGLLASSGCAGEQEPLIVLHSLWLDVSDEEDPCEIDPQSDDAIARGLYDVSGRTGYLLVPVLLNNLEVRTTAGSNTGVEDGELRLEPNVDISVHMSAEVADRLPPGTERSYAINVATDSLGPGERYAISLDVLSRDLIEALPGAVDPGAQEELRLDIDFHATRTGNSRGRLGVLDARAYSFPLALCNGCLIRSCTCDATNGCEPGTERYTGRCGRTQDPIDNVPFACAAAEDAGSSTGSPADVGDSSSGG